jgi:hypothetical protein
VSSLAALAKDAGVEGPVLAVLDARRKEVFAGLYGPGAKDEVVMAPSGLAAYSVPGAIVVGDGAAAYPELAAAAGTVRLDLRQTPSAASVGLLALGTAPVNLAARLCSQAKGMQVIISEPTWLRVRDHFEVRELKPVQPKGIGAPVRIFEVLRERGGPSVGDVEETTAIH